MKPLAKVRGFLFEKTLHLFVYIKQLFVYLSKQNKGIMKKEIRKYKVVKAIKKDNGDYLYAIQAKCYYRNIFGCLIDIKWKTLSLGLKVREGWDITPNKYFESKKEAKQTIKVLVNLGGNI